MIGAIVLGKGVLPPPATFDFGVVIVAIILHMILSVIYAIIIGYIVKNMTLGKALFVGAAIGLIIYFVNFYIMTGICSWFAMARNWVSGFAHVSFGIGAAWAFKGLQRPYTSTARTTTF